MTTRGEFRDLVAGILMGATNAGPHVFTPADWPTYAGQYPVILVSAPHELKESYGERGETEFRVTTTIQVIGKVEMAAYSADYGAQLAEAAVESLDVQIEKLVIGNPAIVAITSQFAAVRSQIGVSAEGEKHIAVLMKEIDLESWAGPLDFFVAAGVPITEIDVNVDLENHFDPTGTYPAPPFPAAVVPAPRTAGPDGRDEALLIVKLPAN